MFFIFISLLHIYNFKCIMSPFIMKNISNIFSVNEILILFIVA